MTTSTSPNSSSNPYASLLKEFESRQIDREEFYTCLYTQTLRDEECVKAYRHKFGPEKPYQLKDSERKMLESCAVMEDNSKKWETKTKFYGQARERFKEYFLEQDTVKARNLSNRFFVEEMREYFHQRNSTELVGAANEILRTYSR